MKLKNLILAGSLFAVAAAQTPSARAGCGIGWPIAAGIFGGVAVGTAIADSICRPRVYYSPGYYYAPRCYYYGPTYYTGPTYYAGPTPVYYAPPPVVYRPAPVVTYYYPPARRMVYPVQAPAVTYISSRPMIANSTPSPAQAPSYQAGSPYGPQAPAPDYPAYQPQAPAPAYAASAIK